MLVDGGFYNTYESAEGKQDKKAGPAVSGAVNRFLRNLLGQSSFET